MIAAKEAGTWSAAFFSFSTSFSSLPRMASISRRPALNTALFSPNHLGSSKPQMLPAQPPASQMTIIPPISYRTDTAPD